MYINSYWIDQAEIRSNWTLGIWAANKNEYSLDWFIHMSFYFLQQKFHPTTVLTDTFEIKCIHIHRRTSHGAEMGCKPPPPPPPEFFSNSHFWAKKVIFGQNHLMFVQAMNKHIWAREFSPPPPRTKFVPYAYVHIQQNDIAFHNTRC